MEGIKDNIFNTKIKSKVNYFRFRLKSCYCKNNTGLEKIFGEGN